MARTGREALLSRREQSGTRCLHLSWLLLPLCSQISFEDRRSGRPRSVTWAPDWERLSQARDRRVQQGRHHLIPTPRSHSFPCTLCTPLPPAPFRCPLFPTLVFCTKPHFCIHSAIRHGSPVQWEDVEQRHPVQPALRSPEPLTPVLWVPAKLCHGLCLAQLSSPPLTSRSCSAAWRHPRSRSPTHGAPRTSAGRTAPARSSPTAGRSRASPPRSCRSQR